MENIAGGTSKPLTEQEKAKVAEQISTNRQTYDLLQVVKSHKEVKDDFHNEIKREIESSEDSQNVEEGILKFIEWLKSGKIYHP